MGSAAIGVLYLCLYAASSNVYAFCVVFFAEQIAGALRGPFNYAFATQLLQALGVKQVRRSLASV
eukprot:scaffold2261_cov405-Prasinococcus_capsulatus_cf.AAC.34